MDSPNVPLAAVLQPAPPATTTTAVVGPVTVVAHGSGSKKTLTSGHRVEITIPHEPMRQDTDRFWNFDDVVDDDATHAAATAVDDNVGAAAVDVEAPLPLQPPRQQGSSSINAGPKKSIGCWNGFVQEISPLYVLFWCIVCGLVAVAVVGVLVVGVDDDDSDYNYYWGWLLRVQPL